jgi:hypothetical protein
MMRASIPRRSKRGRVAARVAGAALLGTCTMIGVRANARQGPGAIPNFAPDDSTAWLTDRPMGDDFLPPPSGPGPVMSQKDHPYIPNGAGQPTYRVADIGNPILKPWAAAQMKNANDAVLAGKVPFLARERCWPAGVPGFLVDTRNNLLYLIQTPTEVTIIHQLDQQTRHVYLNVPHKAGIAPSWYGDSVGHYEGDTLVVDTIGLNDRTFVDNYRTPHTTSLHVVERFRLIEGGKTLEATVTVEDPGAYNMPWRAVQRWRRLHRAPMVEEPCAENNGNYFNYDVKPIPQAREPEF